MMTAPQVTVSKFKDKFSEIIALNSALIRIEILRKRRELLKMLLIGYFLYKDLEAQKESLLEKKEACIEKLKYQAIENFELVKKEIDRSLTSDDLIAGEKENQLLALLNEFNEPIDYLVAELSLASENSRQQNGDVFLALTNEILTLRNCIITHNSQVKKRIISQQISRFKNELFEAENEFRTLFYGDRYFSKKALYDWKSNREEMVNELKELRSKAAKLGLEIDFKSTIDKVIDAYNQGEKIVKNRNIDFIQKETGLFGDFFDTLEKNPLTAEQRKAIVTDEESVLVVAGAGTGKTSTIVGKVGYIMKKRLAEPQEILILSFNAKVAEELRTRLSRLQGEITIKTYHSFGKEIIAHCSMQSPSVSELASDTTKFSSKIAEFLNNRSRNSEFANLLNKYFLYLMAPYKSEFEFKSLGEYIRYLRQYNLRSLNGDKVKSFEECYIANFLYTNGIQYKYEQKYQKRTVDEHYRQYKPDFYLPDYNLYIEHFGINRKGEPAPFVSAQKYKEEIKWKRETHVQYGTSLIETYSYEQKEGKLLENLEKKLQSKGVKFAPIPQEQVLAKINELGRVKQFTILLANFLNLFKASGKTTSQLKQQIAKGDERTQAFVTIFSTVYDDYTNYLKANEEIDFNDMLIEATHLLTDASYQSPYRYILVDEFQDISISRYLFLNALQCQNNAHIFCVGDDWQSIYRFTGSDISLMVDFSKKFKFSEILTLTQTFRFNDKISDFSSKFILSNPLQITKHLVTKKRVEKPAVVIVRGKTEEVLADILENLSMRLEKEAKAYIIGRYKPRPEQPYLSDLPKKLGSLTVEYTTAHSSKGLEAEYVIVLGLKNGTLGFPCQITDDPVLNLVLAREDGFPNAEERRLFYVAVTRAKKQVFLIYDPDTQPSSFLIEIQNGNYEVETNYQISQMSFCPICKTGEITRKKSATGEFYPCNNYPYCNYIAKKCPNCSQGYLYREANSYHCSRKECTFHARVCPACDDGYIVKRNNRNGGYFFGCSRYPRCNYRERPDRSMQ